MAHILKQPSLLLCSLPFQTLSKVSIQYFSLKKTFTGDKWRCNAGNLRTQRTVFLTIVCIDDVHYSKFSPLENLLIKCQPLHSPPLLSQTQALGGIVSEPMFLFEESASHTHNQDQPTMKIFSPFWQTVTGARNGRKESKQNAFRHEVRALSPLLHFTLPHTPLCGNSLRLK